MGKIKILMVLGNTGRGGAQTFAMNILRSIDRSKFQIDFIVNEIFDNGYTYEMRSLGSRIYVIPYYRVYNHFKYLKVFGHILENNSYNIVHGNVSSSAIVYLKCAKKHGCVTILHSHSSGYRGNLFEVFIKRMYTLEAKKQADYWFACSEQAALRLFGKGYEMQSNYHYIPNAIQTSRFLFNPVVRDMIRERIGITDDIPLYGHIGSFTAPKNHMFLLEVFKKIHLLQPNSKFILIGDGELRHHILEKIKKLGLSDSMVLTGNIANANQYMMAVDTMIFPSLFEGFPISVLEAEASGLNIVLSDTITNEVFLTKTVHPLSLTLTSDEWAKVAISSNESKIDRLKCNQVVSESNYNVKNSVKMLSSLYEKMINNNTTLRHNRGKYK